jgi:hypothetical protein
MSYSQLLSTLSSAKIAGACFILISVAGATCTYLVYSVLRTFRYSTSFDIAIFWAPAIFAVLFVGTFVAMGGISVFTVRHVLMRTLDRIRVRLRQCRNCGYPSGALQTCSECGCLWDNPATGLQADLSRYFVFFIVSFVMLFVASIASEIVLIREDRKMASDALQYFSSVPNSGPFIRYRA